MRKEMRKERGKRKRVELEREKERGRERGRRKRGKREEGRREGREREEEGGGGKERGTKQVRSEDYTKLLNKSQIILATSDKQDRQKYMYKMRCK